MRSCRARGAVWGAALALAAAAPGAGSAAQDGVYTAEQADRGAALYDAQCASCHGPIRAIVPEVAALLGDHTFRNKWRGRPLGKLLGLILETMPQDAPGTLTPEQAADLTAHVLGGNRLSAGETPLPGDPDSLPQPLFER